MVDEIGRAVSASVARGLAPISRQVEDLMAWRKSVGEIRNGVDGVDGKDGANGLNGKDGANGVDGKDGARGDQGLPGMDGAAGRDGLQGKDGAPGKDGLSGKDGRDGKDGEPGRDAPPVDLDAVVAKVLPLVGVPKDGRDGRDGVDGKDGRDGATGRAGNGIKSFAQDGKTIDIVMDDGETFTMNLPEPLQGEKGDPGRDGSAGLSGKDGRDGIDGKDGAPGIRGEKGEPPSHEEVSAAITKACEAVLPSLIAKHFDSMIDHMVTRASLLVPPGRDGMPGRPGTPGEDGKAGASLESVDVATIGDRKRQFVFLLSDGSTIRTEVEFEGMVLHRDIYVPGESYEKGDAVTYGGSFWIAKRNTKASPKSSDDWRLVVKKGRDGKDAGDGDSE